MADQNRNWTLDETSLEDHKCRCCGEPCKMATGMVNGEDGENVAMYVASLLEHDGVRRVSMYIGLFVDAQDISDMKKHAASLVLWEQDGQIMTSVVTDVDNPSGLTMTREEVLASPFKSLIFEINDFVLDDDPHLGPFLVALHGQVLPTARTGSV